ncbi:MAG: D-alanyl-D-alanine carboxypeptidase/D-alanyl-D-alanine endopeptidase, partial [Streptosporangiaceae bacterium]
TPISVRALKARLHAVVSKRSLGKHLGFAVAALGSSHLLWQLGGPRPITPASTLKLLTTTAALDVLGPQKRFATTVVRGGPKNQIVLVGGGDPLLTDVPPAPAAAATLYPRQATLLQLARRTALRLRQEGLRRVTLSYDTSLFSGPQANPQWPSTYIPEDVVSPISPLWVNEGRPSADSAGRVAHPAAFAAHRFAQLLGKQGINVRGAVTQRRAPAGSTRLAAVYSAPLAEIVEHILELSDNEGAEVLLRQVAIGRGLPGSSTAGVSTVRAVIRALGIDLGSAVFYDGSGLSRHDRVPVRTLIQVLQTYAAPANGQLRTVVTTLPVAGFTGTLAYRFVADAPRGVGVVRAKTGTLTG